MEDIRWISFEDTVPVPVLASRFALSRESVRTLFEHSNGDENEIRCEKDGAWIQWLDPHGDGWNYDEAEHLTRIEVEGVEFFTFDTAPYQFNFDDETMAGLGYSAYFHPGGGIVVSPPDTAPRVAARRIIADLETLFGRYAPERLNAWAKYAAAVPSLDRVSRSPEWTPTRSRNRPWSPGSSKTTSSAGPPTFPKREQAAPTDWPSGTNWKPPTCAGGHGHRSANSSLSRPSEEPMAVCSP